MGIPADNLQEWLALACVAIVVLAVFGPKWLARIRGEKPRGSCESCDSGSTIKQKADVPENVVNFVAKPRRRKR